MHEAVSDGTLGHVPRRDLARWKPWKGWDAVYTRSPMSHPKGWDAVTMVLLDEGAAVKQRAWRAS